jgi:hypothetical protein
VNGHARARGRPREGPPWWRAGPAGHQAAGEACGARQAGRRCGARRWELTEPVWHACGGAAVLASLRACHAPSAPSAAGSGAPPRRARRARRERPSAAAPRGRQAHVSAPTGGARRQSATAQHARVSPPSRCGHAAPSAAAEQLAPRGAQCGGPGAVHTPACAAAPAFAPHLQVLEHGERCRHLLHRLAAQHHVVRAVGAVDGDGQVCARRGRVRGRQPSWDWWPARRACCDARGLGSGAAHLAGS